MAKRIGRGAGIVQKAVTNALEANMYISQKAHTKTDMRGRIDFVRPTAFPKPVVGGNIMNSSSTTGINSGKMGMGGNEARRNVRTAVIIHPIKADERMRRSDNRAEARERAEG